MPACSLALRAAMLASLVLCGCGRKADTSVRGVVTWKGSPVAQGSITFFPLEGTDPVRGAEIVDGEFHVRQLTPGKRRVSISLHPDAHARATAKGDILILSTSAKTLASIARQHREVDVQRGEQEIDFNLDKK